MAKEKQPLIEDLELGTKLSKFKEPQDFEMILDLTKEDETGSGHVGRWSEGFRDPSPPKHGTTTQKATKVRVTTKPASSSESEIPGLWPYWVNKEYCCIYRVPNRLRRVNPEAYTPQMLLIGPLQHSKKIQALELCKTDLRYMDYVNMEFHKTKYLDIIANKCGDETVKEFRGIIQRDEQIIRESYAESTDWIKSEEFVEMILHDSVFILWFFIQTRIRKFTRKGDMLFEEPCLINNILEDLMLLENQLPYVLLEELSEPFLLKLQIKERLRDIILRVFEFEGKIRKEVGFRHFTDLFRRVRVETLDLTNYVESKRSITNLYNADKLDSAGVDFESLGEENDLSLVIDLKGGILKMPCFTAEDNTERVVRNLMALEQCHYPGSAFVCNYIAFLDFLIDTEQDVDLLIKKGVIRNWLGHHGSVADMVNKLCLGLVEFGSYYYDTAQTLNDHYQSRLNRSVATLRRVYFKDLWTGTATVAAVFILVLTLIGTVASVIQAMQKENKPSPPPAPTRGP